MNNQKEFIKLLKADNLVSDEVIEKAIVNAPKEGVSIEDYLVEQGIISVEKKTELKAGMYGMSYENLNEKEIDNDALNFIPLNIAENYKIICFEKGDKKIKVGVTDPGNFKAIEAINFLSKDEGYSSELFLISEAGYDRFFRKYKSMSDEISSALEARAQEDEIVEDEDDEKGGKLDETIKSAPVSKIVSVIMRHAFEGGASDIHIEPARNECRVRYRIDGILRTSLVLPKNIHAAIISRIKVMTKLKLDETRVPQDGRTRMLIDKKDIDFRVSVFPLSGDEKVVMRILDTTKGAPSLEDLGYEGRSLRVIKENIKNTFGLFLITGPTGSGKSTTLFSVLNMLNKEDVNISTLEDPVEYFIKGVNQSQVRPEIGFTFAGGLRSLLRQDPDVIMVGEIRDNETAELTIHAGLTGHFVLSTLHTNSSIGTIPRLTDMHVEPFLLGSTINIVIAQRLVRKNCEHCREDVKLPPDILNDIKKELSILPEKIITEIVGDEFNLKSMEDRKFVKGRGCSKCGQTGYSGRLAIAEVIDINDKLREIVVNGSKSLTMKEVMASQDFVSMKQDGILKVIKGDTTMEEVLRVVRS